MFPASIRPIFSSYVDVNQYDQYLVIDGKRIEFTQYYPERENKVSSENIAETNNIGRGKRYIHECIVKFMGRNFYASCIMDVYQRK